MDSPTGLDVDVTFGYPDGTVRVYTVKGFVPEKGATVLGVRPHIVIAQPNKTSWPVGGYLVIGSITLLAYRYLGPWGLLALSLALSWGNSIWQIAKHEHAKKVLDAKHSADQSSDQRSES